VADTRVNVYVQGKHLTSFATSQVLPRKGERYILNVAGKVHKLRVYGVTVYQVVDADPNYVAQTEVDLRCVLLIDDLLLGE